MFSADPYEEVRKEISQGVIDEAMWLRSFAESGGNQERAVSIYYRRRAEMYAAFYQAEQMNLRRIAKEEEAERKRAAAAKAHAERQEARRRRAESTKEIRVFVNVVLLFMFLFGLLTTCHR